MQISNPRRTFFNLPQSSCGRVARASRSPHGVNGPTWTLVGVGDKLIILSFFFGFFAIFKVILQEILMIGSSPLNSYISHMLGATRCECHQGKVQSHHFFWYSHIHFSMDPLHQIWLIRIIYFHPSWDQARFIAICSLITLANF